MSVVRKAGWELEVLPQIGGSIARLSWQGHDILRPAPPDCSSPRDAASYPLIPYANRVADGRFRFEGRDIVLPRNVSGEAYPLHGVGWLRSWDVERVGDEGIVLALNHRGDDDWPWRFRATQTLTLGDAGLEWTMSVENRSRIAMPAGLGQHPYFCIEEGSDLSFRSSGMWMAGADLIPTALASAETLDDWSAGAPACGPRPIDNCFVGWSGTAVIDRPRLKVELTADGATFLHVYRPPSGGVICLEPTTHAPDAFNRAPNEVITLAPGAGCAIATRISARLRASDSRAAIGNTPGLL